MLENFSFEVKRVQKSGTVFYCADMKCNTLVAQPHETCILYNIFYMTCTYCIYVRIVALTVFALSEVHYSLHLCPGLKPIKPSGI